MYTKPNLSGRQLFEVKGENVYNSGHLACPGCGVAISAKIALKVLGKKTILVVPACCFAVIDGPFPHSAAGVPLLHCAFESAAATASGVRAGLAQNGIDDVTVVAWAGDGGTYDIGLQALSAAAERNEDIIYVCYDNEAYMNTGIQRSGATPAGAWTTTTPAYPGKPERKKDLAAIMIAHRIPYFATASVSYLDDFAYKFEKAKRMKGFRFIHLFSPCTAGWKHAESDTINLGFLAVQTRLFPLYEVEDEGRTWRINADPEYMPLKRYLERQGRFKHMKEEDVSKFEAEIFFRWEELVKRCNMPVKTKDRDSGVVEWVKRNSVRGAIPTREEFSLRVKNHFANFSDSEEEIAYSILRALWNDAAYAQYSDEEILSRIITRVHTLGCA